MAKSFLLEPRAVGQRLETRFSRQRSAWLQGQGAWPLRLPLGVPTETEAAAHKAHLGRWLKAWQEWSGPGEVSWTERRWARLGTQRLPAAIHFAEAAEVADFLGLAAQWRQASDRLRQVGGRWPGVTPAASSNWEVLAHWSEADFARLLALLDWLAGHPDSGLFMRQLPVAGVDGKWLERHRRVVTRWLGALQGREIEGVDFHVLTGLRPMPDRLRLRCLDAGLRRRLGGLGDIEVPVEEAAALALPVHCAFIVENLQTGLAFEDLPGAVVFMKQGYAVDVYARIPWLQRMPVFYWGDLDTNGFAILDRLRVHLPAVRSLLMDEATLLRHRPLWTREDRPSAASQLPRLAPGEAALYAALRSGRWGQGVRLEQERIAWPYAWEQIGHVIAGIAG